MIGFFFNPTIKCGLKYPAVDQFINLNQGGNAPHNQSNQMSTKHNTIGKGSIQRNVNGGIDKYYTKPFIAEYYNHIIQNLYDCDAHKIIEPTAGNGAFLSVFQTVEAYDLEPGGPDIIQKDVFTLMTEDVQNSICIGNPPFGMNGSMAIKIMNHLMANQAHAICFILPRSFKKQSMQNKLDINYHLVFENDVIDDAFVVSGTTHHVPCVFQIWERKVKHRVITEAETCEWLTFVKPEEGEYAIRRAGGRAGRLLQGINHAPSSTYFIKIAHQDVLKAIQLMNLDVASYTAGVRSISQNEIRVQINHIMRILTNECNPGN